MRPSDLLLDFGRPVAYYPGLVKRFGSVNAVIFFSQIFYWQDKTDSELGVYKSSEDITSETGLSYREQLTARKHLVKRGILIETDRRLEHKIYYRIDCDQLDQIMTQTIDNLPNAQSAIGESHNGDLAKQQNERPPQ
ncbi:DNA-binding protein, partial [Providencia huashanensis]